LRKNNKLTIIFGIVVAVSMGLFGCSPASAPATTSPEVAAIRAYADPATQTALEGLSEANLAKYSQYADAQFKAAVTQDLLNKVAAQVNGQLGSFVSATFLRTEKQDVYTIVHYRAKYAKGEAGVRMVFDKDHLIAGQFFE
jgi:hypothetical protein